MPDNLQPVINKVLLHLHDFYFVQDKQLSFDDLGHLDCVYSQKDSDGREITRCAFGALLGPEPIPEKWEGHSVFTLMGRFIKVDGEETKSIVKSRLQSQGFWPDTDEHIGTYMQFLTRLQNSHDVASQAGDKKLFESKLREMFYEAELEWPSA